MSFCYGDFNVRKGTLGRSLKRLAIIALVLGPFVVIHCVWPPISRGFLEVIRELMPSAGLYFSAVVLACAIAFVCFFGYLGWTRDRRDIP